MMKISKTLLGIVGFILINNQVFAEKNTNVYLRLGGSVYEKYKTYNSKGYQIGDKNAEAAVVSFAVEATREITEEFEVGIGIGAQYFDKSLTDTKRYSGNKVSVEQQMPDYKSVPVYLVTKYNFDRIGNWRPYLKWNIGYSFNKFKDDFKGKITDINTGKKMDYSHKVKADNGAYLGMGGGVEYKNFLIDLMYEINRFKIKIDGESEKRDYDSQRVTLSIGYRFNF